MSYSEAETQSFLHHDHDHDWGTEDHIDYHTSRYNDTHCLLHSTTRDEDNHPENIYELMYKTKEAKNPMNNLHNILDTYDDDGVIQYQLSLNNGKLYMWVPEDILMCITTKTAQRWVDYKVRIVDCPNGKWIRINTNKIINSIASHSMTMLKSENLADYPDSTTDPDGHNEFVYNIHSIAKFLFVV